MCDVLLLVDNSPIYAVDRGKVIFAGFMSGYGLSLIIKHKDFFSLYGHCSKIKVENNNFVRKGQTIANTGSTGNASTDHLHFEYHNANKEAVNPMIYLTHEDGEVKYQFASKPCQGTACQSFAYQA